MTRSEADRFHAKVLQGPGAEDCWLWTGAIGDDGYGRFWTHRNGNQKMIRAHRYALAQIHDGLEAIAELEACHTCDNPICVRVGEHHVYLGTRIENMADRAARGRHNRQTAAQFWRYQTQQERALMERALRDHILTHGWDEDAIGHLLRGGVRGQGLLF